MWHRHRTNRHKLVKTGLMISFFKFLKNDHLKNLRKRRNYNRINNMLTKFLPMKYKFMLHLLLRRVMQIYFGNNIKDKIKILMVTFTRFISYWLRKKYIFLEKIYRHFDNKLMMGTYVRVYGLVYNLIDYNSLVVISPFHEEWIWKILKPNRGEVFIDIGAHIGKYSLPLSRRASLVIAIEPHPLNYEKLLLNINKNGIKNVIPLNIAAWKEDCIINLNIRSFSGGHSIKIHEGLNSIKVKARKIDTIVENLKLDKVDWVKIDVEAAETEVIMGMKKVLEKYKPKIIIEIWDENFDKVKALLEEKGYMLERISREHYYYAKPKTN